MVDKNEPYYSSFQCASESQGHKSQVIEFLSSDLHLHLPSTIHLFILQKLVWTYSSLFHNDIRLWFLKMIHSHVLCSISLPYLATSPQLEDDSFQFSEFLHIEVQLAQFRIRLEPQSFVLRILNNNSLVSIHFHCICLDLSARWGQLFSFPFLLESFYIPWVHRESSHRIAAVDPSVY